MPLLFSYGTLQQKKVQLIIFGRLPAGEADELPKFERASVKINDAKIEAELGTEYYASVTFNGKDASRVDGTVFEITDAELAAADRYEKASNYVRGAATLASGRQAWIYADARSARSMPAMKVPEQITSIPKRTMKKNSPYFLAGQFSMAIGVLLNIFIKENEPAQFISGFLIGLSLVFNIAFYFRSQKEKTD
jgi:gamma-glutamylcyclotransferase (GGCT)/AIG2-like uncharacterized protein YtfP